MCVSVSRSISMAMSMAVAVAVPGASAGCVAFSRHPGKMLGRRRGEA